MFRLTSYRATHPDIIRLRGRGLNQVFQHRNLSRTSHGPTNRAARALTLTVALGTVAGASFYLFYPDTSRSAPTSTQLPLSPSHFTPATIVSSEICGPDTKLLQLVVPPSLLPHDASNPSFLPIWSVFIKDDEIQVERPYTPLQGIDEQGRMLFWIKKYPKGEVGRWLHSKSVGDQVELRGPLTTWPWKEDEWDEIVMISGGTGITPFYQLFGSVISRSSQAPRTRFTLLHSSRTPAEIPPAIILDQLSTFATENPERFTVHFFVDSTDETHHSSHLQVGRIGKPAIEKCLGLSDHHLPWWSKVYRKPKLTKPLPKKTLFLICGPEPMISAISGPYGRNFSQGPIGGVLAEMGFTARQVWKL